MKTIIVVYSNNRNLSAKDLRGYKKYAFNTSDDSIKVGDFLDSDSYSTKMIVVKVLDKSFKYYNASTGNLSDEYTSTEDNEIATMVIREDSKDIIYASRITEE